MTNFLGYVNMVCQVWFFVTGYVIFDNSLTIKQRVEFHKTFGTQRTPYYGVVRIATLKLETACNVYHSQIILFICHK